MGDCAKDIAIATLHHIIHMNVLYKQRTVQRYDNSEWLQIRLCLKIGYSQFQWIIICPFEMWIDPFSGVVDPFSDTSQNHVLLVLYPNCISMISLWYSPGILMISPRYPHDIPDTNIFYSQDCDCVSIQLTVPFQPTYELNSQSARWCAHSHVQIHHD